MTAKEKSVSCRLANWFRPKQAAKNAAVDRLEGKRKAAGLELDQAIQALSEARQTARHQKDANN